MHYSTKHRFPNKYNQETICVYVCVPNIQCHKVSSIRLQELFNSEIQKITFQARNFKQSNFKLASQEQEWRMVNSKYSHMIKYVILTHHFLIINPVLQITQFLSTATDPPFPLPLSQLAPNFQLFLLIMCFIFTILRGSQAHSTFPRKEVLH